MAEDKSKNNSKDMPSEEVYNVIDFDGVKVKDLDLHLTHDVMSTPTQSRNEFRMVTFLVMWARKNGVQYEFDDYGNLYFTKGSPKDGEYYPCVTSHLDTVQTKQTPYANGGVPLELKLREKLGAHELYVDGMGIGADCKTGIVICLHLIKKFDAVKACFFLEEESGLVGSSKLNKEWFNDVSYVIGWDSPELNRAAYASSGTNLFDVKFFEEYIEGTCKKHGLTVFNSEPITDVLEIRKATDIICMNFGNGGYLAHSLSEYMVLEDTDHAIGMGIELMETIPVNKRHLSAAKKCSYGYYYANSDYDDDDIGVYFGKKKGTYVKPSNNYSGTTSTSGYSGTNASSKTTKVSEAEDMISVDCAKYIRDVYEAYINNVKSDIVEKCNEKGIDSEEFLKLFNKEIKF